MRHAVITLWQSGATPGGWVLKSAGPSTGCEVKV
jgi:hypothetical protein